MNEKVFQSTLPRGSDAVLIWDKIRPTMISIHAPSRERRYTLRKLKRVLTISIHAPSRERPQIKSLERGKTDISIHAPSRERLELLKLRVKKKKFQSTLPRGSDWMTIIAFALIAISIHAPSRERLLPLCDIPSLCLVFQSTLPRGSDSSV